MQFTDFSQKEWDTLMDMDMSPAEVAAYFYAGIHIRTFSDIVTRYAAGRDVRALLLDRFCAYDPALTRDNVRKKISNWLSGRNRPDDRDELIKICFALDLDEKRACGFMQLSADGGFHLRNPKEVAFLYGLRVRKTYPEAVAFAAKLKPFTPAASGEEDASVFTKLVADAFASVGDDETFLRFYNENLHRFGYLHNTAYKTFTRMFNMLVEPGAALYTQSDTPYSIEQAVDTYLRMNLPMDKKKSEYTAVQKMIRNFWPNATAVKNIRGRKEDVTRKILLLLYVVTEGVPDAVGEDTEWPEDLTPAEVLETHAWNINIMLDECGMSRLDPRNPFDWLILYSLKSGDDTGDGMSGRMQSALTALFPSAARNAE